MAEILIPAVADGSTDNVTIINNTLASGGNYNTFVLPSGVIMVSDQITPLNGQTIRGYGMYTTFLKRTGMGSSSSPVVLVDEQPRVTLRDLSLDGSNRAPNCFIAKHTFNTALISVRAYAAITPIGFQYKNTASFADGCTGYLVQDCQIEDATNYSIFLTYCAYGRIIGNAITGCVNAGINLSASNHNVITGNFVSGAGNTEGFAGIRVTPGTSNAISGNVITDMSIGVSMTGGFGNSITGNTIKNTYQQAILAQYNSTSADARNSNWNVIANNAIYNPWTSGIASGQAAIECNDHGTRGGCQGNSIGAHAVLDDRSPVHISSVFRDTMTGGGPTYPNKYDTTLTNSNIVPLV